MKSRHYIILFCITFLIAAYSMFTLFKTPSYFPINQSFIVNEAESLSSISNRLESEGYINSSLAFRVWVSFVKRDRHVQLGEYVFSGPLSLTDLIDRLTVIGPTKPLIIVTIPEGKSSEEIADILTIAIPSFSKQLFLQIVKERNAYGELFPSTYFLLPSTREAKAVDILTETFSREYDKAFADTPLPLSVKTKKELLSFAAILEGEAKGAVDMKVVAGILTKRLERGMLLQVDVAPTTYKLKGLPKVPINNPGIVAMDAVFNPKETPYLYYLTGDDGLMYYAKTYEEHKRNIAKYLK